jgi:GNAT superfamily N-acetyltransferase
MEIRPAVPADHDALFAGFSRIVEANEGFPQDPPLERAAFEDYWLDHSSSVMVLDIHGAVAGAYYLKANFVGRGAHVANGGYFVVPEHRGIGAGRALVAHSLVEARRLGFDALQFNLVFESNPARALYESFGFEVIGRVPRVIDGEDALIYWLEL